MHIYCIHITNLLDEAEFNEFTQYVSPDKKAKIQRFRKPIDAIRSLLGDLIIRTILCRHYGLTNDEIYYEYLEFGKPYLPNHLHLHFNISHSGYWVVGVVSKDPIGIDIEKITDIKLNLPSLVLTGEENKKLQTLNDTERNSFFFQLWTLKESYVKAIGTGLSEGLNTLEITFSQKSINMKKNEKLILAYFETMEIQQGYQLSRCSLSENPCRNMRVFLLHEFTEEVERFLKMPKPNQQTISEILQPHIQDESFKI